MVRLNSVARAIRLGALAQEDDPLGAEAAGDDGATHNRCAHMVVLSILELHLKKSPDCVAHGCLEHPRPPVIIVALERVMVE